EADIRRAAINPSAVMPMNVPPRRVAARKRPQTFTHTTLAATPSASAKQAAPSALRIPMRLPSDDHSDTDGMAANPTAIQIHGSKARTPGELRTIATRKVAGMTYPNPNNPYASTSGQTRDREPGAPAAVGVLTAEEGWGTRAATAPVSANEASPEN